MQTFEETYFNLTRQDYKRVDISLERTTAAWRVSLSTWGNGNGSHLNSHVNKRISQELPRELAFSKESDSGPGADSRLWNGGQRQVSGTVLGLANTIHDCRDNGAELDVDSMEKKASEVVLGPIQ